MNPLEGSRVAEPDTISGTMGVTTEAPVHGGKGEGWKNVFEITTTVALVALMIGVPVLWVLVSYRMKRVRNATLHAQRKANRRIFSGRD